MLTINEKIRLIQEQDPDAGSVQPTDADYARFEKWIVERFGENMLDIYYTRNSYGDNGDQDWMILD